MPVASSLSPNTRFTRGEIQQMSDAGLFEGQRYELIDGELINKAGQTPRHAYTIHLLLEWLARFFPVGRIQVQLPIEAAAQDQEHNCPEPDLAVLAEAKAEYSTRFPGGSELLFAAEIADSSAHLDLIVKAGLYARAGIPEYWVLDIRNRVLIVHRHPERGEYGQVIRLSEGEWISLEGHSESRVVISKLMPDS